MDLHTLPIPDRDELLGISLCAGYAGLDLGIHIAEPAYRTVCYVEREAHAAATLVARMADAALGEAAIWSDLATFDGSPWRGRVHLVSAGYPCQPFSTAGKRRGVADPRHLWPHVRRIVDEAGPEWVFCENVEGHLDLGFADVCRDLQGLGFEVAAGVFAAGEVGAPHLRRRMFLLAHADRGTTGIHAGRDGGAWRDPVGDTAQRAPDIGRPVQPDASDRELDGLVAADAGSGGDVPDFRLPLFAPGPDQFAAWERLLRFRPDLQPSLLGVDDGMADRLDRTRGVGNGVCSLAAALAFRTLRASLVR